MVQKKIMLFKDDFLFNRIMEGKEGEFNQYELMKILNDCKKKNIPFRVTDDDLVYLERIV